MCLRVSGAGRGKRVEKDGLSGREKNNRTAPKLARAPKREKKKKKEREEYGRLQSGGSGSKAFPESARGSISAGGCDKKADGDSKARGSIKKRRKKRYLSLGAGWKENQLKKKKVSYVSKGIVSTGEKVQKGYRRWCEKKKQGGCRKAAGLTGGGLRTEWGFRQAGGKASMGGKTRKGIVGTKIRHSLNKGPCGARLLCRVQRTGERAKRATRT